MTSPAFFFDFCCHSHKIAFYKKSLGVSTEKSFRLVGWGILYLSITVRLQLPFYGVAAPEHIFVRYDDGTAKINIETTLGGKIETEEQIREGLGIFFLLETVKDGIYFKNLTKRQVLSCSQNFAEDFALFIGDC